MAFVILFPAGGGAPRSGFGSHVRVQTSLAPSIGDFIRADLTPTGGALTDHITRATSPVAGSSRICDLFWGWDDVSGVPELTPLPGPIGYLSATIDLLADVTFSYFNSALALLDGPTTFAAAFTHDPTTQSGYQTLFRLFNQMQDIGNTLAAAIAGPSAVNFRTPAAGLTGTGVIPLVGALGARIVVTTVPASWGSTHELPPRYIPALASLQFGLGTAFFDWSSVHYPTQLVTRPSSYCNSLRYNIRSGVICTITLFDGV